MSALRELAASFGIEFDNAALKKGNAGIDATKGKLAQLGVQFADLRVKETALSLADGTSGKKNVDAARALARERAALEATKAELEASAAHAAVDLEPVRRASEAQAQYKASLLGTAAALGVTLHWLEAFASAFTAEAHAVTATAATLRVTTTQLQEVQHAGVMAGLSLDESTAAFSTFTQGVRAAAYGGGEAAQAFWRLGIRTRDASHQIRSSSDVLDDVAARFDRVQNPARRARLATQLFGEAGARLIPILHAGAGGLAEWRAEVASLGGGFSPEALASARTYEQSLERWRITSDALRSELAAGLLPVLARFVDTVRHAGVWIHGLLAPTHGVRNALALLGVAGAAVAAAMLVAWAPVIAPFLLAATAIGAVYLIVDDLITLFEGGHSVIGEFIDDLFGVGSAQGMVRSLTDAWQGLSTAIHDAAVALGILQETNDHSGQSAADRALTAQIRAQNAAPTRPARTGSRRVDVPAGEAAPAGRRAPRAAPAASVNAHYQFTVLGTDPTQAAQQMLGLVQRTQRNRRDAQHPLNPPED